MCWRTAVILGMFCSLVSIATPSVAQESADPRAVARGMNYAYRWCSTCHHDSNLGAPRFVELVEAGKTTPEYLKRTVENPPHNMMKFTIGQSDLDNLSAYFASLPAKSQ